MVMLGYEEGSKAYRLYDPNGGKVVVPRDVVFDEMAAWDWEDQGAGEAAGVSSTFVVEHLVIQGGGDDGAGEQAAGEQAAAGEQSPPAAAHSPLPQSPATAAQGTPPLKFASPPTDIDKFVDAFHDGEEVRFRRVDNIVGEGGAPKVASRLLDDPELLLVSAEEPPTFTVAKRDTNWRSPMFEEMRAIEDNGTWELVDPLVGCRLIGLK